LKIKNGSSACAIEIRDKKIEMKKIQENENSKVIIKKPQDLKLNTNSIEGVSQFKSSFGTFKFA
jgi:hypothetical protein